MSKPPDPATAAPDRPSLRDDVVSGLRWVTAAYYLNVVVRLAISVTLARLLAPADFGVMTLAMAVIGALALVQESGFSSALVQYPGAVRLAAAGACLVSVGSAILLGGALAVAAPAVSAFFEHPELLPVLRVLAAILVVRAAGNASRALLQRDMRFRDTAAIDVAGTAVYGVVGMALAARGHGVWSLVHAQLACELTRSAVAFLRSPLRFERACLDLGVLRDLARFGRHVVAANALGMLQLQLPAMVVGKLLGATSLGLYEMALRWAWMPVQGVTHVAGRVSFPAFARLRDRPDELAAGYARAFQGIVLLALPAGVGLALAADPLIRTLYGARWDGAIAPLRVLAFTGLFHALAATTGEVFKGIGRPGFVTGLAVVYDVVLVVALWLLGMEAGLLGVAVATLVAPLVTAIAAMAVLAQLVPVRGTTLARIVARAAVASAVMATAVWAAAAASPGLAPPLALARSIVVGVAAYVLVVRAVEPEWFGEATSATGLRAKRRPPVAEERAASGAA